jgi:YggT family protein
VNRAVDGLTTFIAALRPILFWVALAFGVVFVVDWAVRTRRISPFRPVARFFRSSVDPLLAPMERVIVRAGSVPSSAPWWALVLVVLGGIVLLGVLGFVRDQMKEMSSAMERGSRGLAVILIAWTFQILQFALIWRVIASWVAGNPHSRWWRWSFTLTEPMLRPLRQVIPTVGMIDVTPLVAYFLLRLVEGVILGGLL